MVADPISIHDARAGYDTPDQFARVPRWLTEAAVSDGAVALYALLACQYIDFRSGLATHCPQAELAKKRHTSTRRIRRLLRELAGAGAIDIIAFTPERAHTVHHYRLHYGAPWGQNGPMDGDKTDPSRGQNGPDHGDKTGTRSRSGSEIRSDLRTSWRSASEFDHLINRGPENIPESAW
jgi:hypothetical protein